MGRKIPMFYNALLLTAVNLLLRLGSTSFQVFLSGRIGAAGVGLLQLVLSVGGMAITAGMAGIRTATMYLTAEALGKGRHDRVQTVLSACLRYSLLCSGTVAVVLYGFAPKIAELWIGDWQTSGAIRLLAVFLPVNCLVGVMVGYFTAANRIGMLAAVEVAEQLCAMAVSAGALVFWAGEDLGRACQSVVLGSCAGGVLTLVCLVMLHLREKNGAGEMVSVRGKLVNIAVPLALADDLKVGINTVENLMVPKRLAMFTGAALAQFGMVSGMVFPVVMFPAAILFGLADLLIPEMARCNAAGSRGRIRYLARRSLRVACIYGIFCGGILYLWGEDLCLRLYGSGEAGSFLRMYALLMPMLYCDLVVDAMNKGLGQQKICVRYNICTALMDVAGLYFLLPRWGMTGYFVSFLLSHAVNATLSLRLLMKTASLSLRFYVPLMAGASFAFSLFFGEKAGNTGAKCLFFSVILGMCLYLGRILRREDVKWLGQLVRGGNARQKNAKFLEKSV